jgi:predicted nuclease of predicted toxin-antitoxin system
MQLLLDQGVPRDAAALLRELGLACTHVSEIGMSRTADSEILALALREKSTVVTLDADFHAILAVSGAAAPSVVRLRVQGLGARALVKTIQEVLAAFGDELSKGALVTVKEHKTTCCRLPVGEHEKD